MAMAAFLGAPLPRLPALGSARGRGARGRLLARPQRVRRRAAATVCGPGASAAAAPEPAATRAGAGKTTGRRGTRAVVIVPGKFDAFHLGHQALVRAAAAGGGAPVLLSFSGMAEVLAWTPRSPVVASVERPRVLREWARVAGTSVGFKVLAFEAVRALSPAAFLDLVHRRFGAAGIVCGPDWRFGYRAQGDTRLLRQLCAEQGMSVQVVDPVRIRGGPVSSTRVREALAVGDVVLAAELMGRPHRIVGYLADVLPSSVTCTEFVNQIPGDGMYEVMVRVLGCEQPIRTYARIRRPPDTDPLTPPALLLDENRIQVTVFDASSVFCEQCEVYIDFVERVE